MPLVDLSHTIHPGMPVYPGAFSPSFEAVADLEEAGWAERRVSFHSHTGTHLDVPAHLVPGGADLGSLPPEMFYGRAALVPLPASAWDTIGPGRLRRHRASLEGCDFAVLSTGWWRRWSRDDYFEAFPRLSPEAARLLAGLGLKGVGLDTPSPDPLDAPGYPAHRALLDAGVVLIENLANLDAVPESFTLACFPLPLAGGDGCPVRAVAVF